MKVDWIHEALNLLDDDLIGEVEHLRARKKSVSMKWISWAAMAACMCIVMGSLFTGLLQLKSSDQGNAVTEGIQDNQAYGELEPNEENASIPESETRTTPPRNHPKNPKETAVDLQIAIMFPSTSKVMRNIISIFSFFAFFLAFLMVLSADAPLLHTSYCLV